MPAVPEPDAYPIVLEWDLAGQAWNVRVPDLPGCLTFGQSGGEQMEAVARAREAIACHLRALNAEGGLIPPPNLERSPLSVRADVCPLGLPALTPAPLVAALRRAGFEQGAWWGVHKHFRERGGDRRITIPGSGAQVVPQGTVRSLLRAAGLDQEVLCGVARVPR